MHEFQDGISIQAELFLFLASDIQAVPFYSNNISVNPIASAFI
jgi:hypothetical protein